MAVNNVVVKFIDMMNPTKRQKQFLVAMRKFRYLLYGGARGGGKSYLLRWALLRQLLLWYLETGIAGIRVGIFCEDFPTLRDRQISKVRGEFPEEIGVYVGSEKEFRIRQEYGGGVMAFRNLDDPSKYQSAEFAAIGIDELTKNPSTTFDVLRGSLRWPGIAHTLFLGATNPGGPGHLWVKSLWLLREFPPELESRASEFHYIKALPTDNPHNDPGYILELASLNEKLRRAWLEGDWDVFEGQVFEEWRKCLPDDTPIHVLPEFKPPPMWVWVGGLDFGHRAYGYLGIGACGPDEVVIVDELPFKNINATDAGRVSGEKLKDYPPLMYIAADEEMFWRTGHGPTKAELFQDGLNESMGRLAPSLIEVTHGRGSRGASLELFHDYLAWKQAEDGSIPPWWLPKLRFHRRCRFAIKTIPALPYDKNQIEDVDTDSEDHAYDAIRYLLMSRVAGIAEDLKKDHHEPDTHPGLDKEGKRPPWADQYAQQLDAFHSLPYKAPRYDHTT